MIQAMAKPEPLTLESATSEVDDLWAAYHAAREGNANRQVFDELSKRARKVSAAVRKRREDPAFAILSQRVGDLRMYLSHFKPKDLNAELDPEELEREVSSLHRDLAATGSPRGAMRAKVEGLLERIRIAREARPEGDDDHDDYVSCEEQLWDMRQALAARRLGGSGTGR